MAQKRHWTQTTKGRQRMAEIARQRAAVARESVEVAVHRIPEIQALAADLMDGGDSGKPAVSLREAVDALKLKRDLYGEIIFELERMLQ